MELGIWPWLALNLLFFLCLGMAAASMFTPKTAWFFREKTKRKGTLLWLGLAVACVFLSNMVVPEQFKVQRDWLPSLNATTPPSQDR